MERFANRDGGYGYRWRQPNNGKYGFRTQMFPNRNTANYRGPFGTIGRHGYTPLDIPYRDRFNGDVDASYGQGGFGHNDYRNGGRRRADPWGPLRGVPEFGRMDLRDMPYQRLPKRTYGPYFDGR